MHATTLTRGVRITRRHVQIALGLLWLLDGALQLQPFMLGTVAGWTTRHGTAVVVALVVLEALIGLAALSSRSRRAAVAAGFVLALAIWVVGQDFGQLYSGQATDPNTAPLIALLAIAMLGDPRTRLGARAGSRRTHPPGRVARRDFGFLRRA
jgi:hypothetical protein